jgi:hypothetical protein
LLSGLAIGFAAGARLTSLPLVMPITLAPLVFPGVWKRKIMLMFCAGAGAMIGLAPTIWTASLAPAQFYFDNFRFPRLRLLDPTDIRAQKTVTWWRKGRFFFKKVIVPSWPMFLAYALFGVRSAKIWRQGRNATHFPCALILAVIPFVLAGCFAPSRYQYQHYYAFIPLLALGIAYGAHTAPWKVEWARRLALAIPVLGAILLELTALAKDRYAWVDEIRRPERWFAIRAHATAQRIREHVPSGKVLTLAPAWPIEAGLAIYPEFASGPFAWRSAPHLNIEQRRALHLIGPDDLAGFLAHDPPAAILTGFESSELEKPLRRFATEHGYGVVDLGKDRQLWVRPR